MVDYADSVVKGHSEVQEKKIASVASVEIPFPQLSFAIVVAIFIYVLGYQNSTIAQAKHSINLKKSRLIELNIQMASLRANRAKLLSSSSIVADSKARNMKIAQNVQIVY